MSSRRRPEPPSRPEAIAARLHEPGWFLLPLRAFLGLTFCYAGLQKLANPRYLDPHSPTSVQAQMAIFTKTSPIGPLVALSAHHAGTTGLLIAFGELAVGLGVLLGLWTRLAAAGGIVLSLSFLLTVSWSTTPYYYGADVVFVFAWTPFALAGSGGVLALDGVIAALARRDLGLPVRSARPARAAAAGVQRELDRRTLLRGGAVAAAVGTGALLLGGLTAAIGRLVGGTNSSSTAGGAAPGALPPGGASSPGTSSTSAAPGSPSDSSAAPGSPNNSAAPGSPIAAASRIPVGHALQFQDARSGSPAWLVHETPGRFLAFSAVCTHAGCTVDFDRQAQQFSCPCHGATYDARTGRVTGGPAPSPLPPIAVVELNGQVRQR